jgi:outer membrane protein OmpA-like peptidoglycan-associated protein
MGRIASNGNRIITCLILMIHLRLKKLPFVAMVFVLLAPLCTCLGQIQVDTSLSAPQLVKEVLLGEGVAVSNVRYTGPRHAIAYYRDSTKIISITQGLLLTSGSATLCQGPNRQAGAGWSSRAAGHPKLDAIAGGQTHDAAVLEFDFVTASEQLTFNFIFASEEYQEYVGSKYNDVFAFFIQGPGLPDVNLAMLPRSRTPVTINSINHRQNRKYYVDNPTHTYNDPILYDVRRKRTVRNKDFGKESGLPKYNIQYDGFTTVLEATCKVVPGEVYHIQMAIADVGDYSLDSGIFLEAHSFRSLGGNYVSLSGLFEPAGPPTPRIPAVEYGNTRTAPEPEPVEAEPARPVPAEGEPLGEQSYKIEFAFDSSDLTDSSSRVLEEVYRVLQKHPEAVVEVVGHTDCIGPDGYNDLLSERRAAAVARYLAGKGVAAKVQAAHRGERLPLESNLSPDGRARNRRTEIFIRGGVARE